MKMQASAEASNTCEGVVRMPRTLEVRTDASLLGLLKELGYFDRHAEITLNRLQAEVSRDPTLVNDWLQYSENKRTSSGWYIRKVAAGYEVGFLREDGRHVDACTYADGIEACAAFIKKEVEEMRRCG